MWDDDAFGLGVVVCEVLGGGGRGRVIFREGDLGSG